MSMMTSNVFFTSHENLPTLSIVSTHLMNIAAEKVARTR